VNEIRLRTKRKFAKELANHRAEIICKSSEIALRKPNNIWRSMQDKKPATDASSIPLESWKAHYEQEFSPPCPEKSTKFKYYLDT
jgi:hypothetical protein